MTDQDKKNIADIKKYVKELESMNLPNFRRNRFTILNCFAKAINIIEANAAEAEKQEAYIASMEEVKERYPAQH